MWYRLKSIFLHLYLTWGVELSDTGCEPGGGGYALFDIAMRIRVLTCTCLTHAPLVLPICWNGFLTSLNAIKLESDALI